MESSVKKEKKRKRTYEKKGETCKNKEKEERLGGEVKDERK